jgi:hypothetical protein
MAGSFAARRNQLEYLRECKTVVSIRYGKLKLRRNTMQKVILIVLFCLTVWVTPTVQAEEAPPRLWQTSSENGGGELKEYLVNKELASEDVVSILVLTEAAMGSAIKQGYIKVTKEKLTRSELVVMARRFYATNQMPIQDGQYILWQDFAAYGQANDGFTPLTQADYDAALEAGSTEVRTVDTTQTTQQEVESAQTETEVVATPQQPAVSTVPTKPRLLPITTVNSGEMVGVIRLDRKPVPTQAEMEAFLEAEAKAERDAAEAAKQEAEAEAESRTMDTQVAERTHGRSPLIQAARERYRSRLHRADRSGGHTSRHHAEAFLRDYFSDIPVMVEIARCESTFDNVQSNLRYQGERERSFGFFQIHEPSWHSTALELGLDQYQTDAMQNVLLARHLYELDGLNPWRFSKDCWGPQASRLGLL